MNKITWLVISAIVVVGLVGYWAMSAEEKNISTYDECVAAGNVVATIYPSVCTTKDGRTFDQPISEEDEKKLVPPSATETPPY